MANRASQGKQAQPRAVAKAFGRAGKDKLVKTLKERAMQKMQPAANEPDMLLCECCSRFVFADDVMYPPDDSGSEYIGCALCPKCFEENVND